MYKQLVQLYGDGYNEAERKRFKEVVFSNVTTNLRKLVKQSVIFLERTKDDQYAIAEDLTVSKEWVASIRSANTVQVTPEVAMHFQALWADPAIQATYEARAQFQLSDSCAYFMERLEEISSPGYVPSLQDVLHSRVRTTGIVENEFQIDSATLRIFDVGGQRNERRKWIHCFDGVTAVLFVAALSGYDQRLFEDRNVNRLDEALNLFEHITSLEYFEECSVILFLNKRDIFQEKLASKPLTVWDPDYHGGPGLADAYDYIQRCFEERLPIEEPQPLYTHFTCATDTENMKVVLAAVKDIIIRASLIEGGLMDG